MRSIRSGQSTQIYKRLLSYVRPYWRTFGVAIASMALLALSAPALPALLQPLLDGSFVAKDPTARWLIPSLIILVFLIRGVLSYVGDVTVQWVSQKVVMDLRAAMFRKLVTLPSKFYDNAASGGLISKLTFDVAQVADASTRGVIVLVQDSLAATGLIIYLNYCNWRLALIILLMAPIVGLIVAWIGKRLRKVSRRVQQSMGLITQVAQETIECQKAVKIFAGQAYEIERFEQAINRVRQFTMKVAAAAAANGPLVLLVLSVALAFITYLAGKQAHAGSMTVGEFVSFFTAIAMLLSPIKRLTGINEHLQRGVAAAESVFALIDRDPEPDQGTVRITRADGKIEFRDVSLSYDPAHAQALRGVSVVIAPGETVALVGASGSGKSSFVNLISRFYSPSSGQIFIDGVDIEAITLTCLRGNIALVSQEVILFNDSIRSNIAYGAMRASSEAEVVRAAEAAHVMEFVQALPAGLDTVIGENGVRLSGGQRQRLAIARAVLKDAPILILDEASSSLDSASERHIQEALEDLRKGRTCIIIAHRLSTIENADRIIVLDKGTIAETGTHADLIAHPGVYTKLHRLQFKDARRATPTAGADQSVLSNAEGRGVATDIPT
ncbi:MAG: lipid A export permease/ATP-binding protein MsbA [Gammaproteobacteria bacterium]